MRRMMFKMSLEELANALGLSWQQVRKYEKGVNRISASRLQEIALILRVSPPFFFGDAPDSIKGAPVVIPEHISDFMATRDGLGLLQAFSRIKNRKLRRAIVELVEQIVPD